MKIQITLLSVFLGFVSILGCGQSEAKRYYEEIAVASLVDQPVTANDDPHVLLKEMIARGEDPHSGMREPQGGMDMGAGMAGAEGIPMPAAAAQALQWTVPEGWSATAGQGMRLATFTDGMNEGPIECTIVSLSGNAGGLDANVVRWLGQLKMEVPPPEVFDDFLSRQEKLDGENGVIFLLVDLTGLQPQAARTAPTMLAAMGEINGATVFVKMTGSISAVQRNQEQFKSLCRTIRAKE